MVHEICLLYKKDRGASEKQTCSSVRKCHLLMVIYVGWLQRMVVRNAVTDHYFEFLYRNICRSLIGVLYTVPSCTIAIKFFPPLKPSFLLVTSFLGFCLVVPVENGLHLLLHNSL